jgi:hypothetical protein
MALSPGGARYATARVLTANPALIPHRTAPQPTWQVLVRLSRRRPLPPISLPLSLVRRLMSSSPGCFCHLPVDHLSGPRYSLGVCWPPLQTSLPDAHADRAYFESAGKPPLLHSSDKTDLRPDAKDSYGIHLFGLWIKSIFKIQVCSLRFLFKVPPEIAGGAQRRDPAYRGVENNFPACTMTGHAQESLTPKGISLYGYT